MLIMSKHYPVGQRERAVKMALDHLDGYWSAYAACQAIGPKVGVGAESLRDGFIGCSERGNLPYGTANSQKEIGEHGK
jgi:hypothetical protein